ncbi:pyocin R2_PP, tail formation [Burkholderia multivorans]|uniref:Pyocin R2_PP, tail formation n=1 Tax=Burkholderia multivorans TaxID=87883 RepID=A0ABD7LJ93_9BURK|nr:contractile injection system protein, VgrG/Pvc8 family [Burkholderia multivorans]MBU9373605.1 late control protein [Burkholderia multivorans]MBU9617666.1 late control protein [Burkholderia multivorans]MDN7607756.1 contractile injection system protein, VgrG/Pvc8 family [Burkholderia multivorans]MDN7943676.1 contractile injection system protein, VgrG/Pvc8 family [Burkholderia multivorans]SAK17128.1 pyocin R2_PP, tail formation [Burkholderia multivorans]
MQAIFQVVANGDDITRVIQDRVLRIQTTDKPGLEADECEIELDDRDGKVRFPPKGATLKISLGWEGQGLSMLGEYAVDEIVLRGPPATIIIRGRPANMRATSKTQRYGSWSNVKLADIVGDVARRNKWAAACSVDAAIPRADQFGESDLHFITRIARQYGATATVKAGKLIVGPIGGGKSASGKPLPAVTLTPSDLADYEISFPDRASFVAVRAKVHDKKTGKKIDLTIPNPDAPPGAAAVHIERHAFASPEAAKAGAKSRLEKLNRHTARSVLRMKGRADISAEKIVKLSGFKQEADGDFLVDSVRHTYAGRGWETSVELNAGNKGKAKVGHRKKPTKKIDLVVPALPK